MHSYITYKYHIPNPTIKSHKPHNPKKYKSQQPPFPAKAKKTLVNEYRYRKTDNKQDRMMSTHQMYSRPEDELIEMSIMNSLAEDQYTFSNQSTNFFNPSQSTRAKIVNYQSVSKEKKHMLDWMKLCSNHNRKTQRKSKCNESRETLLKPDAATRKSQCKIVVLKNQQLEHDEKQVTPLTDLSHRYTFVNEYGSSSTHTNNNDSTSQSKVKAYMYQLNAHQQPQLKQNIQFSSYRNNELGKLPMLKKSHDRISGGKGQSEYLQRILNYLNKAKTNRVSPVNASSSEQDISMEMIRNKQKINWKISQRYNARKLEKLSLSKMEKKDKEITSRKKIESKATSISNNLMNKSLEECLIFVKK